MNHLPTLGGGNLYPRSSREPGFRSVTQAAYPAVEAGPPATPYFRTLWARKGTLGLFALAGLLLALLALWRQPYIYQAHLFIEVQGINQDLLNRRELDPTAKSDNSSLSFINTEARILQSGPLYERTAAILNAAPAHWNPPFTRAEMARSVRVRTSENDRILELVAESPVPARAAAMANGLAREFIRQDLQGRVDSSQSTSQWLTRQLDELADRLHASEEALLRYAQRSHLLIDNSQDNVNDARFRQIEEALATAEADRIAKQSAYEATKAASPLYPQDGAADQYEQQLNTLRRQLAELEATYTPEYYKIPPLKAQIATTEKALTAQREANRKRIENDYRTALTREHLLESQYDDQFREATGQTAKMVEYAALKNQVDTNRSIYAEMLQKVKGFGVTAALQPSNLRVVDPAEPPRIPARPNKPMIAILTSFGFLCVGIFWVLSKAAGGSQVMNPGETQQYLMTPELGVIPSATRAARLTGEALAAQRLNGIDHSQELETIAWHSSPSMVAESFRATSASLLLPKRGKERPRVLLITSVSPGEGKTTVASNMAIALAGVAGRVLLIDADRRRGRLHKVFDCPNAPGLSELLQSEQEHPKSEAFLQKTMAPDCFLLPSGRASMATSDLFYSEKMAALIRRFREEFDTVLIDTPPLMHLPDARILGRLTDGVILVLRAAKVRRESVAAAEHRLRQDGVPLIGTILNDWNSKKNGYGVYPDDKGIYSYFAR